MKQQTGGKVGTTRSTTHSIHQQQREQQQQKREHKLLPAENVKGQHWLSALFVLYQRDQNV